MSWREKAGTGFIIFDLVEADVGWMGYTDLVGFDHVWWLGAPGLDYWFGGIRYLRFGPGLPLPIGSSKLLI